MQRRGPGWHWTRLSIVAGCVWLLAACASAFAATAPDQSTLSDLGRKLFFDPSLSASGKLACATCHDPTYAYGPPPGKALAHGGVQMEQVGIRAVPSLRYLHAVPAFAESHRFADGDLAPIGGYTWDGRVASLEAQARIPLLAANEMANQSAADVAVRLAHSKYAARFRRVFGQDVLRDPRKALDAAAQALAAFQQVPQEFFPFSSKYDAFLRGEVDLTDQEERGVELFKDPAKGNCASCHIVLSVNGVPPLFTDFDYVKLGAPRNRDVPANADPTFFDLGLCGPNREDLRAHPEYCGMFRAPTLRNAALRDAFFHNGVFHTLGEVMHFYVERDLTPERFYPRDRAGKVVAFDDLPREMIGDIDHDPPLDRPAGSAPALNASEIADIIAFIGTLTDGYQTPGLASSAPHRDPRPSDVRSQPVADIATQHKVLGDFHP